MDGKGRAIDNILLNPKIELRLKALKAHKQNTAGTSYQTLQPLQGLIFCKRDLHHWLDNPFNKSQPP